MAASIFGAWRKWLNLCDTEFDSVSCLFPVANVQWRLAEVRVISGLRCWGKSPGKRLVCNSFPQLTWLYEQEQTPAVYSFQPSRELSPWVIELNILTTSKSFYWYVFSLFLPKLKPRLKQRLLRRLFVNCFFSLKVFLFLLLFKNNCLAQYNTGMRLISSIISLSTINTF